MMSHFNSHDNVEARQMISRQAKRFHNFQPKSEAGRTSFHHHETMQAVDFRRPCPPQKPFLTKVNRNQRVF